MDGTRRGTPMRPAANPAPAGDGRTFLLVERPAIPWAEATDGWTPADRAEYERARRRAPAIVLLEGSTGRASVRAPAVLRESLLSLWGANGEDAEVRRELARLAPDEEDPPRAA